MTAAAPVVSDFALTEPEITFYKEEGYLPLPGFVNAHAITTLQQEVYRSLESQGVSAQSLQKATSDADRLRQCPVYVRGSALDELINGERSVATASKLIGGPAHRYLPFTAVKAGGGGGTFDYHQDNNYTNHDPALGSINIWIALVDMTPDNGCLRVIPRSHLGGQLPSEKLPDGHKKLVVDEGRLLPLRMRAGDAVAFTRWTVHGSGPNTTDQPRLAYALQYHREDVKWLDAESGEWKLLIDTPRKATPPVDRL